ncbi:MAG: hypothetical protein AB7T37_16205 [Dehalococcoidia bacterium]
MELSDKIAALEDEINVLKVEVKAVLVDIRDELIKRDGPFAGVHANRPAPAADSETGDAIGDPGYPKVVRLHGAAGAAQEETFPLGAPPAPAAPPPAPAVPQAAVPQGLPASAPVQDAIDVYQKQASFQQLLSNNQRPQAPHTPGTPREWGVLDIASMGKWAEAATKRVGRKRLEELLGVYELLTGEPQAEARKALLLMLDLCGATHEPPNVSMNDVVTVLSQLDALFRSNSITEVTVLSLLSDAA